MICAGNSRMMYDFYIYCGKELTAMIITSSKDYYRNVLPLSLGCLNIFMNNVVISYILITGSQLFDIFQYLRSKGINAVGTVRENWLHG